MPVSRSRGRWTNIWEKIIRTLNLKLAALAGAAFVTGAVAAAGIVSLTTKRAPSPDIVLAAQPTTLPTDSVIVGTGNVTGVYFPVGGAVCRIVNQAQAEHGIRCTVESTGGSLANLAGVRAGMLGVGVVQSDWQFHAFQGTASFAQQGPFEGLRALFSLYTEPLTVVVRADSGIQSFTDLLGMRVQLGAPGTSVRATTEALLDAMGWASDDFEAPDEFLPGEEIAALCTGAVDALLITTGHPNGMLMQLTSACEAAIVPVVGGPVDQLIAETPYYAKAIIPGGLYPGNLADVPTFGVGTTLVAADALPDEIAYQIVRAVFEDIDGLIGQHPAFTTLSPSGMARSLLSAPLHPGAERYYRERGLL